VSGWGKVEIPSAASTLFIARGNKKTVQQANLHSIEMMSEKLI
jgi:hypothetical protein